MELRRPDFEGSTGLMSAAADDATGPVLGASRVGAELRLEIDSVKNEVSQIRARKESLEQVLAHRSYTTESVKRLFASLENGKAGDLKPLGVLADYVEVDPQYEKPAEDAKPEKVPDRASYAAAKQV